LAIDQAQFGIAPRQGYQQVENLVVLNFNLVFDTCVNVPFRHGQGGCEVMAPQNVFTDLEGIEGNTIGFRDWQFIFAKKVLERKRDARLVEGFLKSWR
jgi:hypothetical protein